MDVQKAETINNYKHMLATQMYLVNVAHYGDRPVNWTNGHGQHSLAVPHSPDMGNCPHSLMIANHLYVADIHHTLYI